MEREERRVHVGGWGMWPGEVEWRARYALAYQPLRRARKFGEQALGLHLLPQGTRSSEAHCASDVPAGRDNSPSALKGWGRVLGLFHDVNRVSEPLRKSFEDSFCEVPSIKDK